MFLWPDHKTFIFVSTCMLILTVFVLKFRTFSKHLSFSFINYSKFQCYKDLVYKYNFTCKDLNKNVFPIHVSLAR